MSDDERELRTRFARTEARLTGSDFAPLGAPREVVRRTRRRQIVTALATVGVIVALVAASVVGVGALIRSAERRIPAEPPDTFAPGALEAVGAQPISFDGLVADTEGRLWSTGPGLTVFDPASGKFRTFTSADDPAFAGAGPLAPAREGGVWMVTTVATGGQAIRRFDGERFVETSTPAPTHYLGAIVEAPDGTLWAGGDGVLAWDGSSWRQVPNDGRPEAGASTMTVDAEGGVWVQNSRFPGPKELGLSRFDGSTWTTWTPDDGLSSNAVYAIDVAPNGDVWVGTDKGVGRFADGAWTSYPTVGLGLNRVLSVAVASDGTVWIGGEAVAGASGTARFDGTTWSRVDQGVTIDGNQGTTILRAGNRIWAVVNGALLRWNGEAFIQVVEVNRPQELGSPFLAVGQDELWTGDWGTGGAWRLLGDRWTHFDDRADLPGELHDLALAPDGTLWAATKQGVWRFDGSSWQLAEGGNYQAIGFGPDGGAWVAGNSIVQRVGGSTLPGKPPFFGGANSLAVLADDDVWAGSSGGYLPGGLVHFDGRTWTPADPLGGDTEFGVRDIQVAPDGYVWVSIVNVDYEKPNAWDPIVVARSDGTSWQTYEDADGVSFGNANDGFGRLDLMPDGTPVLAAAPGLVEFRDGAWTLLQAGSFGEFSIAPDGTIWLSGDGLFRLREP